MTRAIPYWHIDAFADRAFTGNQAAVMIFDAWPDDRTLQAIAEENKFAETAFLIPCESRDADWELRWFMPSSEVRLCGHATLASGHVLLSRESAGDSVRLQTRWSGVLELRRAGEAYELALPTIATTPDSWDEAVSLLGGRPQEVRCSPDGYNLFAYGSQAEICALTPDFRGLAMLGNHQFIATAPGTDSDVVSRVFLPAEGVDEDSVTGSAHAVLTPYWAERLGRNGFTAHQASARGGKLACRLDGGRVWLGGSCVTVVEGQFFL